MTAGLFNEHRETVFRAGNQRGGIGGVAAPGARN